MPQTRNETGYEISSTYNPYFYTKTIHVPLTISIVPQRSSIVILP